MRSKWSSIRRPTEHDDSVQSFQMVELVQSRGTDSDETAQSHDCEGLQRQAFEKGRKAGLEEGRRECQARMDEAFKRALSLVNHIERARLAALEEHDRDIVEVALAIASKLLLREIDVDKEIVVRQVRQILHLLPAKERITLKVHPDDFSTLEPIHQVLREECTNGAHLVLESDEEVDPGGCLVEQAGLLFDARLTQQFTNIGNEFGLELLRT